MSDTSNLVEPTVLAAPVANSTANSTKRLFVGLREPEPIARRADYIDGQPVQVRVFAPGASSVPPDLSGHAFNAWRLSSQLKLGAVLRELGLRPDQLRGDWHEHEHD